MRHDNRPNFEVTCHACRALVSIRLTRRTANGPACVFCDETKPDGESWPMIVDSWDEPTAPEFGISGVL